MKKILFVILGPTGIGKTDLSLKLAQTLKTVVISADSRQFFKEMAIGTAKPSLEEMGEIRHYFIDSLSVNDSYNAGMYETDCLTILNNLWPVYGSVVMVGGSGLYINALCKGFHKVPTKNEKLRKELTLVFESQGLLPLQEKLKSLDPENYRKIDLNNPHRVVRALEVVITSGKSFLDFKKEALQERDFTIVKIGLQANREVLYNRINQRVDKMMDAGLLDEVRKLFPLRENQSLQTVGYQELFNYLDGSISLDEAVELIKRNSRRYAKRQLTWFNKDKEVNWFNFNDHQKAISFALNQITE